VAQAKRTYGKDRECPLCGKKTGNVPAHRNGGPCRVQQSINTQRERGYVTLLDWEITTAMDAKIPLVTGLAWYDTKNGPKTGVFAPVWVRTVLSAPIDECTILKALKKARDRGNFRKRVESIYALSGSHGLADYFEEEFKTKSK